MSIKPIDKKLIVLESNDDCCDNAYALFDYLCSSGIDKDYRIVWLVDHKDNFKDNDHIFYATKRPHPLYDYKTIKALATCKWYIFDHVNAFSHLRKRKKQIIAYLSHGYAGFKAKKGHHKLKADMIMTTGDIPLQGCIYYFGEQCNAKVLGFSRLDYFYFNSKFDYAKYLIHSDRFKKSLIWMPTFRKCKIKCISEDYLNNTETGLPLLETEEDFLKFNMFLSSRSVQLFIKIHPLQEGFSFFRKDFSNIKIIDNSYLSKNNIQLYQFIPVFDAMITDYSSVSTDYFLLNKPIVYLLDDYEEYKKTRGFYPDDPMKYMPGNHVYSYEQFENAIVDICSDHDHYADSRKKLIPLFHKFQDGYSSKRIAMYLGLEK